RDWVEQSEELDNVIRFFCRPESYEPAASWVWKNKDIITGPVRSVFICIAPDVAVEFYKSGKGIAIVNKHYPRWDEASLAIARLSAVDKTVCIEAVQGQLAALEEATYGLNLHTLRHMIRFYRTLFKLSEPLFEQILNRIDLDNPAAKETIQQLMHNQERERPG